MNKKTWWIIALALAIGFSLLYKNTEDQPIILEVVKFLRPSNPAVVVDTGAVAVDTGAVVVDTGAVVVDTGAADVAAEVVVDAADAAAEVVVDAADAAAEVVVDAAAQ